MERMDVSYCSECGGVLIYIPEIKAYVCRSCGLSFTSQELLETREKMLFNPESEEERKEKQKREYLNWWFKSKREKDRV